MGSDAIVVEPSITRFAERLREEIGATRVLLFGSRARGIHGMHSDYDLVIVAPSFSGRDGLTRATGLRRLWREVGGRGPLDLLCLTPEELQVASTRQTLVSEILVGAVDVFPRNEV